MSTLCGRVPKSSPIYAKHLSVLLIYLLRLKDINVKSFNSRCFFNCVFRVRFLKILLLDVLKKHGFRSDGIFAI